jgi:uncharacterized protein YjbJ (UPF0337 family)
MDKDRVEGIGKKMMGAIKEGAGKVSGDARTEAEGKAEKAAGKVQNAIGSTKDIAQEKLQK